MFGRRNKTVATYSKNRPVQITTKNHFLTPDTPEDSWIPSSKEKSSKHDTIPPIVKKGSKSWATPFRGRGSSLALRNISNIPLEKTLSRTPCVPRRRSHQTNRKLISGGTLPTKVSSSEGKLGKECKTYRNELQRANLRSKKGSPIKSIVLVSTTIYSTRSMSCCSMCGGAVCSNEHSLSTIKSMSLCKSCLDHGISDGEDLTNNMPQVSQPHNSTLVEEDLNIELKDLIPLDLSAILEEPECGEENIEPVKKSKRDTGVYELYNVEEVVDAPCPPKCSTPVDPGKIHILDSAGPDVSPIAVPNKTCVPSNVKMKSRNQELGTNEDVPNITPETVSKTECVATDEPKQKRKLAYSMGMDRLPDCILLHTKNKGKRPFNLLFKHDKSSWSCSNPGSSLPVDFLVQLSP